MPEYETINYQVQQARSQLESQKQTVETEEEKIRKQEQLLASLRTKKPQRKLGYQRDPRYAHRLQKHSAEQQFKAEQRPTLEEAKKKIKEYKIKTLAPYESQVSKAEGQISAYEKEKVAYESAFKKYRKKISWYWTSGLERKYLKQFYAGGIAAKKAFAERVKEYKAKLPPGEKLIVDWERMAVGLESAKLGMSLPSLELYQQKMGKLAPPQFAYKDPVTGRMISTAPEFAPKGFIPIAVTSTGKELPLAEQLKLKKERPELFEKLVPAPKEARMPLHIIEEFKPPAWKEAPLMRAQYELGRVSRKREKETLWALPAGVATIGVGIAATIAHPIETVKGFYTFVRKPSKILEEGAKVGVTLRERPLFATGVALGTYAALKPAAIPKAVKEISPRYVPVERVPLKMKPDWTRRVPLKKELALAETERILTQAAPWEQRWFKAMQKEVEVKPSPYAEMGRLRRIYGERYAYWAPEEALLGFAGVGAKEVPLSQLIKSIIKGDKKVAVRLGVPKAEIKVARAKIKGVPRGLSEKELAKWIMKRPGEFRLPAEIKRPGLQEYQVALPPKTVLEKEILGKILKEPSLKYKKIWTEIEGARVAVIGVKIKKARKPPKMPSMAQLEKEILKTRIRKAKKPKAEPYYYEPIEYYPIGKKVKLPYYPPTKYYDKLLYKLYKPAPYKPTPYYKAPITYYPTTPYKPYKPKPPYYKAPYYRAPAYAPSYYAAPSYYPPTVPKPPKVFPLVTFEEDILKKKLRKRKQWAYAYTPSFTARALGMKSMRIKSPNVMKLLKKMLTGLEVRAPVVVTR